MEPYEGYFSGQFQLAHYVLGAIDVYLTVIIEDLEMFSDIDNSVSTQVQGKLYALKHRYNL